MSIFSLGETTKVTTTMVVTLGFVFQFFVPFVTFFANPIVAYADDTPCSATPGSTPATSSQYGGINLDKAATFLADMDDVTGAYYDQNTDQIVFIGTATTSLPQFDKDDLAVTIRSVIFNGIANPSISIEFKNPSDPFGATLMDVKLSNGLEDTNFGQKLLDADYLLKQYVQGYDTTGTAISSSVPGYQSVLTRWINSGSHSPTAINSSRWWISPQTITLATTTGAFVFDQVVMQVETEPLKQDNEQSWNNAASAFATHMTQNYNSYAQERNEFQKVKQLAKIVSVVKWIKDKGIGVDFEWAKNYTPAFVDTPTEIARLTTPNVDGGDGHFHYMTGGVDYSAPNTYQNDTQGTSTTLKSDSSAAATSSPDGIHWNFNSGNQGYQSVAVSAELFRAAGAYAYSAVDASAPTPSTLPLELKRTYSSFATRDMGFGLGWSILPASLSNTLPGIYTQSCSMSGGYSGSFPNKLALSTPFGRETFTLSCPGGTNGAYIADDARFHSTLARDTDGTYRAVTKDRTTHLFYTGIATSSEFKLIQSYDIHSGDPSSFVRKYYWGPATTTLTTVQDIHPSDPVPTTFNLHNIAFGWNASSTRITSVVAPSGTTTYGYNGNGDLTSVTDPRGSVTTYTYDLSRLLKSITDRVGIKLVENTYDSKKRVATQLGLNGVSKTLTYNDTNLILSWIDTNGRKGNDMFDEFGRVVRSVNTLGATTTFGYGTTTDAVNSIVDARGATSTFIYDTKGNLLTYKDPNLVEVTYTWDGSNNLLRINDNHYSPARKTEYSYDLKSNISSSTIAGLATTTYTYTPRGLIATTTDSTASTTQFFYGNPYGLVTKIRNKLGQDTTYVYDNAGRVTSVTDSANVTTSYTYDANGNKLTATTPVALFGYAYDNNDRLITSIDPVNATTSFSYTPAGNLATTTSSLAGVITHYFYDTYNNLLKIRDALSRDTIFAYDSLNREISSQLPSGKTRTTQYDAMSNPTVYSQPNGVVTTSTYDSLNRLVSATAGATTTTYTYDAAGRLSTVVITGVGTTTYTYDARDRVTQMTNPFGAVVQYLYDALDNLKKITYPDNKTVQNQFNAAGKVTQQIDWTGGITSYTYAPFGALSTTTLPNGITIKREYDSANRLATTTYKNAPQTILFRQAYVRDARGFITSITEDGSVASSTVTTYQYDLAGRLIGASGSPLNKSYGYDQVGNLTTLGNGTATTTYQYSVDNELATSTSVGGEPMGLLNWTHYAAATAVRLAKAVPQRLAVAVGDLVGLLLPSEENKYTEMGDRYQVLPKQAANAGESSVEILKARPEVRLKKWDGEVNLGVSYENVQSPGSRAPLTDRVEWNGQKEEVHAYPLPAKEGMEGGGFEIEVYLKQKLATNVFSFAIDGADNLDFFYQPALTQAEITRGDVRPDNVIGSYAVYHKTKKDYREGGTNYATGKAFHIYRPKAIDANGNETWATLSYKGSALSVEVPQDFLDTATYPIRVDPTFGYTAAGASTASFGTEDLIGSVFTSPADYGSFTSASIYVDTARSTGNVKIVIVNHTDLNIVSNGVSNAVNLSAAGWYSPTFASAPAITASTEYVLTGISDSSRLSITYDSGATNQGHVDSTNSYASPTNPTDTIHDNNKYAVYVTYTAGGGNQAPSSPSSLLAEGQTNPTNISDSTPEFSAIYNDPDAGDLANKYRIQVATSSAFSSAFWDSGTTTMATTTAGNRSSDLSYAGSALASSTTYYWRIAFSDDDGATGAWSTTTATFSLAAAGGGGGGGGGTSTTTTIYTYDGSGNLLTKVASSTNLYAWNVQGLLASSSANGSSAQFIYDAQGNRIAKIAGGGGGSATNSGFKTAGAIVQSTGFTNFTTTRLATSDNSYATSATTDPLGRISTFGLNIPSDATINGLEVTLEAKVSFGTIGIPFSLSWNNGSSFTSTKSNTITTTEQVFTYGGPTDTWGRTWTPSELSDANFQVKIDPSSSAFIVSYDQIRVKVYYTSGGGSTTRYVNDLLAPNALVLAETDANNVPTRLNVWGPVGLVSTGGAAATGRFYPLTDSQGSVRFLTDSSGNVVRSYTYTPYGTATTTTSSASTTPYQYTNENFDSETGLTYLRARYYDPTVGRFISRDPVRGTLDNPITQNPYIYGADNPTTYTDPSGEFLPLLIIGGLAVAYWLTDPIQGSPCGDINPTAEQFAQANNLGLLVFFGQLLGGPEYLAGKAIASASLKNLIKDLYKGFGSPRQIGSGSTADAIRNELLTGLPTEGTFHSQKGTEYISALKNWLNANPNAASTDTDVANALIKDLVDALAGK